MVTFAEVAALEAELDEVHATESKSYEEYAHILQILNQRGDKDERIYLMDKLSQLSDAEELLDTKKLQLRQQVFRGYAILCGGEPMLTKPSATRWKFYYHKNLK